MTVLLVGGGSTGTALGTTGSGLLSCCAKTNEGAAKEISASRQHAQIFRKLQARSFLKTVSSIQGDTILFVTAQRLIGILLRVLVAGAEGDVLGQLIAEG